MYNVQLVLFCYYLENNIFILLTRMIILITMHVIRQGMAKYSYMVYANI